jgi:hypothetical protein
MNNSSINRARIEHSKPQIITCIPGKWQNKSEIVKSFTKNNKDFIFIGSVLKSVVDDYISRVEIYEHDPKLAEAFTLAGNNRFSLEEINQINDHTFILFLIGEGGSARLAKKILETSVAFLNMGGFAVKVETSGLAHTSSSWIALSNSDNPLALFHAFVTLVKQDGWYYSCGMHNLGLKDAIVSAELPILEAEKLLATFLLYCLIEKPLLESGSTFSTDSQAPKFVMRHIECHTYPPDHLFYNPFGLWKLHPLEK